jgi:hypothetical protein|tara:strand:- start:608 stop:988 length:381 start_codon:yes stop_codon:yes gene_type:complete
MFKTAAEFGRVFRSEIAPILKSKGFNLSVATTRKSFYSDGRLNVKITKVPTNFPVWKSEYSRWERTDNAEKLLSTIRGRMRSLISNNNVELDSNGDCHIDIDVDVEFGRSVPYIPYKPNKEESDNG